MPCPLSSRVSVRCRREFRGALVSLGLDLDVTQQSTDELFASFDADGGGLLDYRELQLLKARLAELKDMAASGWEPDSAEIPYQSRRSGKVLRDAMGRLMTKQQLNGLAQKSNAF